MYPAVLDSHVRTSPALMPVMVHLGPAAPAGLTRYESQVFGPEYQENLFAALFNLHKVTPTRLDPERLNVHAAATRTSSSPTISISIRPTCWRMPTAAWS